MGPGDLGSQSWGDEDWVSVTEFTAGYLCTKSSMALQDNLCDFFGLLEALDSTYCFREHCHLEFKKLRQHLKLLRPRWVPGAIYKTFINQWVIERGLT